MIISEKQIMQLMHHCKTFQLYLVSGEEKISEEQQIVYKFIEELLGEILFQQSNELKVVE